MKKTHIIIGASAAGIGAVNKLRQLDPESHIICISDEVESPYNKCMLADYLSGIKEEQQVYTLTAEQAKQKNITLMLGSRVTQLVPEKKQIVFADGNHQTYDTLLLGVGTSPIIPTLEGADRLRGIFTFHRLRDIQSILTYIKSHAVKKAVVVGSGLSGLECADALLQFNIDVSIVEMRDQVLSSLINKTASSFIEQKMMSHNIALYVNQKVEKIIDQNGRVGGVGLASGQLLDADMLVFAVGLKPNIELAQQAGIALHPQGILTDDYMCTSIPSIYAAGDIVVVKDQLSGQLVPSRMWPDAMLQGLVAACNMALQPRAYPGISSIVSSSFFGIKFVSCGPVLNPSVDCQIRIHQSDDFYHLFLIADNCLKGFLLVGNTAKMGMLRQAVMTKAPLDIALLFS